MDNELIAAIHTSGVKIVIAITGGGSSAIGKLLEVPGGSASILEAVVPYSQSALNEFLGGKPDQFCSEPTARAMAMAAWMRACLIEDTDPYIFVGVGMTASLVSGAPKKGEHRIHVGVQTAWQTASYSLTLTKGMRSRSEEEQLAANLLIAALGEVCLKTENSHQIQLLSGEKIERRIQVAEQEWTELLFEERGMVYAGEWSRLKGVFPGAFNPLHAGHRQMMAQAGKRLGAPVAYEISITNVDKPPIDFMEIQNRLDGIEEHDVVLTAAPTFREKAALLPNVTFVVGIDTLVRIADPRYYHHSSSERDKAIQEIAAAGCRFLVFGRELKGEFCCVDDVEIPVDLRELCDAVPECEFHEDVSSTELRRR